MVPAPEALAQEAGARWGGMQFIGPDTIADVVAAAEPSIVNISCGRDKYTKAPTPRTPLEMRNRKKYFGDTPEEENYLKLSGSGVIVRKDGYILTSLHVVRNQSNILVTLSDGRTFNGKVANKDSFYDLALLKIDATELPVGKFADVEKIRKGDWVIAIGNQMGLENSVTLGLISGIGREVKGYSAYGAKTGAVRFIQTDAPVNPGSSGGPLINLKGEVVGINTFIRDDAQNVGFAIPSNIARDVSVKMASTTMIVHPYIGVEMSEIIVASLPGGIGGGVEISTVKPKGPAFIAGLVPGDVITSIEGEAMWSPEAVSKAVAKTPVGTVLKLKIMRGTAMKNVNVRVDSVPDTESE